MQERRPRPHRRQRSVAGALVESGRILGRTFATPASVDSGDRKADDRRTSTRRCAST